MSTQEKAVKFLLKTGKYVELTNKQKSNLVIAFAKKGKAIHKTAFDLIRTSVNVDFSDENSITKNLTSITLIEIKSTDREIGKDFSNYFFGITMGELFLAQSLRSQYKFVFVNVRSKNTLELSISQIYHKIKNLNMVMHIRF